MHGVLIMAKKKRTSSTHSSSSSSVTSKHTSGSKKQLSKKSNSTQLVSGKSSRTSARESRSSSYSFTHTQLSLGIAVILLVGIAGLYFFFSAQQSDLAARVGNDVITMAELDAEYDALDEGTRNMISKSDYLAEILIPNKMLLQRAQSVSDARFKEVYDSYVLGTGMEESELFDILELQGITRSRFEEMVRIQAYILDLHGGSLTVSDEEVDAFLLEQQHLLESEDISEVELRSEIKTFLESQLIQDALLLHIDELRREIPATIYYGGEAERISAPTVGTFRETGDPICTENGKPIIRMFSTTWCPHCAWIKDTYREVVQEYAERGDIVAYLWEVDTQEEALSGIANIPDTEMALFQKYNPRGGVPTFVFGCAYVREGNGYEHQDDLNAERTEFRKIIDMLIADTRY